MYNVNFKTEQELYDKFRIICTINKVKLQDQLTEFIEKYVSDNEELTKNPKIQEKTQQELPKLFGKQENWLTYLKQSDKREIEKIVSRITFLRYLTHLYLIDKDKESELITTLQEPKFFNDSHDYQFLQKNGIIQAMSGMSNEYNLPPIRVI